MNRVNKGSERGDGDKKEVDEIKYDEDPILILEKKGDKVEQDGSKDNEKDDFEDGVEKCQNYKYQKLDDLTVALKKDWESDDSLIELIKNNMEKYGFSIWKDEEGFYVLDLGRFSGNFD